MTPNVPEARSAGGRVERGRWARITFEGEEGEEGEVVMS